jgi:5,10-methylenetetrahydrofolate reductase
MAKPNPVREALTAGRYCYMLELVAGAKTTEEHLLELAEGFMQVPGVVAGSVTSFAGGSAGHDPVRVGAVMQARGLTPNIHLTCVGRDRLNIQNALEELRTRGIENVLAITGDWPHGSKELPENLYDLDSVQLVEMIHEMRSRPAFHSIFRWRSHRSNTPSRIARINISSWKRRSPRARIMPSPRSVTTRAKCAS